MWKLFVVLTFFFCNFPLSADINYYKFGSKYLSFNSFGSVGLIQNPTAQSMPAGSVNFVFSRNDIYKYGALVVTPFNWLEASYFYYRPSDLFWGSPQNKGQYLDKGFSFKISKKFNKSLYLAAGMDDFAGTGFFNREFIVTTLEYEPIKFTMGIGWGAFADKHNFKNPLALINNNFKTRESFGDYNTGQLATKSWFRGPASLFGGLEIKLASFNKATSFKIETDAFDYVNGFTTLGNMGQDVKLREKRSDINFGVTHSISENININLSYIKGNTLNFTFAVGGNFSKPFFNKKLPRAELLDSGKGIDSKTSFFEDLIYNINRKEIFLQSANLKDGELRVAVSSGKYRNPVHVHAILGDVAYAANEQNKLPIDKLSTVAINVGHELHEISSPINAFADRRNEVVELVMRESSISKGNNDEYSMHEFRPTIKYPASFTGITPALVNHIGDPAKFYYGGIILRLDNEIQFSSRLQINTEIHQNITNNFDEKRNYPDSLLPRVRTDVVSYLQESETYISRMQLDYFFNPYREIFGKFSAGILENMYAGAGIEFLYKPFEQNFSIGLEAYRAKKRAFDRKFNLIDYEINTGHINFNYHMPQWGILGTLSFGKYLAGDEGYTFDISRRLSSGFRTGIFFTRTNLSAEQFGEGSFDKGFYFQIPIDLFLNNYRGGYINFKLRPLTRDGGQKLEAGNDLIGIMHTTSRSEIERDWRSFND